MEHSNSNGLIQACLHSETTQEDWRRELLDFLQSHCQRRPRLAGFSVHVDRGVLRTQAPEVYRFVSHQIIDISTLDILQWGLPPLEGAAARFSYVAPQGNHRAMSDNEAAIAKLKWYLRWLKDRMTTGLTIK
jgi:oligoribonuclease